MEKLNQKPNTPSNPSEISVRWLNKVFHTDGIASFEVDPDFGPWSLLGKAIRVRLEWTAPGGGPDSAIVKFQVSTSEPRREGEAYDLLSSAGVSYVPRIYSVFGNGNLIMEDLSQTHSVTAGDLTMPRIQNVLATIADIQNRFNGNTNIPQTDLIHYVNMININMKSWGVFEERYREQLGNEAAAFEWIANNPETVSRIFNSDPTSLSHGDVNNANLLFPKDGSDQPIFIDWQLSAPRVLPYDLSYFIVKQLTPEQRLRHETRLLREYYDQLSDELKKDYSFDRMMLDYRACATRSMLSAVMRVGPRFSGQPNQFELADKLAHRVIAAIRDLKPVEAFQELERISE